MNADRLTCLLLQWYNRAKRDLPWRRETDPYRIWVSEIMLQQTRVEAVVPYYQRFLRRFPDMRALAEAPEEVLLSEWQGLGYYSRARNLQKGVREVMARYGGRVPDSYPDVAGLPGIGEYTAGAILSIAYNKPAAAVDGNVLRVFSRLLMILEPIENPAVRRRIESEVRAMQETDSRHGDITQALMELGAVVCVPRTPRCDCCPWQEACLAFRNREQALLPRRRRQAAVLGRDVYTGVLVADGRLLASKRPSKGLLAAMWEFPSVGEEETLETAAEGIRRLTEKFRAYGQEVSVGPVWFTLKHTFSHREWRMQVFRCRAVCGADPSGAGAYWMDLRQAAAETWAGPHRKIVARVLEQPGE